MPRPRVPTELKLLKGTARRDRDYPTPDYRKVKDVPPPEWLKGKIARAYWETLMASLGGAGVLTEPDLEPLAHLCRLHQHMLTEPPHAPLLAQYRMFCNEFGITPASRAKVAPPKAAEADFNPFAKAMGS
jgi:phage terminase small subunit